MSETPELPDASRGGSVLRAGEDMRLQFECPKCNAVAWVEWRQLPHLLRCRGCENSFWIDKSGHIQSEHEVGSVSIKCPRCQEPRQWPKGVVLKETKCLICGFDFSINPDSPPDSLSQQLAAKPQKTPTPKKKTRQDKPMPRLAIAAIAAGALLLFCLAILAIIRATRIDEALIEAVQAFNAAALVGESKKAKDWVPTGEETAFETWMLMNTGNRPLVRFEPVEVEVVQYSSHAARVRVSYQRTIQDVAHQCQSWRRDPEGRWRFDPAASLRHGEDGNKPAPE
jgi:phage FluMu protein Com